MIAVMEGIRNQSIIKILHLCATCSLQFYYCKALFAVTCHRYPQQSGSMPKSVCDHHASNPDSVKWMNQGLRLYLPRIQQGITQAPTKNQAHLFRLNFTASRELRTRLKPAPSVNLARNPSNLTQPVDTFKHKQPAFYVLNSHAGGFRIGGGFVALPGGMAPALA